MDTYRREDGFVSFLSQPESSCEYYVRRVWATNSQWGIVYHTEDLLVCESESERVCPFDAFMLELPETEEEHEGVSAASSR